MDKALNVGEKWSEANCRWAMQGDETSINVDVGCPVCNGLEVLENCCPWCGQPMEDKGSLEDYLGPYSPSGYLNCDDAFHHHAPEGRKCSFCVHLMYCSQCNRDLRLEVSLRDLF
ncbi:MAG: hypothetical protein ACYDG6_04950 [Thermincolia bacterium]